MRLYRGKIPTIAEEVLTLLRIEGDIELENEAEARLDVEAVLKEYLRLDREILEEAKNRMEHRGLSYSQLGRTKSQVAKERGAPGHEDILPYLLDQILNILDHSGNIAEIFVEDNDLRLRVTPILRKHMDVDTDLDREVRTKIKNLQEGSSDFDVQYERVMGQLRDKYQLS